jgi:hypothetical protein
MSPSNSPTTNNSTTKRVEFATPHTHLGTINSEAPTSMALDEDVATGMASGMWDTETGALL